MQFRQLPSTGLALILLVAAAPSAAAEGRVQLELVGDAQGSALAFQDWLRVLSQAGVENVRMRVGTAGDQVGIAVSGTAERPVYVVTGIVRSGDELILPGGRYRKADVGRLARWLDELARLGPADRRPPRTAFGLTAEQFAEMLEDLSQPVLFETQGMARREVVEKISRQLRLPLQIDPEAARALGDETLAESLQGLSSGTALACVLRPPGWCLVPRAVGSRAAYAVVPARGDLEIWPIGWPAEKDRSPRDVLPGLYEFRNVNVQNVAASAVVPEIGKRLGVPVLWDHNAMARHGIDPQAALVSHPQARTTYSLALRKLLFQAGLKFEVRIDEADNPFLWISTVKPV